MFIWRFNLYAVMILTILSTHLTTSSKVSERRNKKLKKGKDKYTNYIINSYKLNTGSGNNHHDGSSLSLLSEPFDPECCCCGSKWNSFSKLCNGAAEAEVKGEDLCSSYGKQDEDEPTLSKYYKFTGGLKGSDEERLRSAPGAVAASDGGDDGRNLVAGENTARRNSKVTSHVKRKPGGRSKQQQNKVGKLKSYKQFLNSGNTKLTNEIDERMMSSDATTGSYGVWDFNHLWEMFKTEKNKGADVERKSKKTDSGRIKDDVPVNETEANFYTSLDLKKFPFGKSKSNKYRVINNYPKKNGQSFPNHLSANKFIEKKLPKFQHRVKLMRQDKTILNKNIKGTKFSQPKQAKRKKVHGKQNIITTEKNLVDDLKKCNLSTMPLQNIEQPPSSPSYEIFTEFSLNESDKPDLVETSSNKFMDKFISLNEPSPGMLLGNELVSRNISKQHQNLVPGNSFNVDVQTQAEVITSATTSHFIEPSSPYYKASFGLSLSSSTDYISSFSSILHGSSEQPSLSLPSTERTTLSEEVDHSFSVTFSSLKHHENNTQQSRSHFFGTPNILTTQVPMVLQSENVISSSVMNSSGLGTHKNDSNSNGNWFKQESKNVSDQPLQPSDYNEEWKYIINQVKDTSRRLENCDEPSCYAPSKNYPSFIDVKNYLSKVKHKPIKSHFSPSGSRRANEQLLMQIARTLSPLQTNTRRQNGIFPVRNSIPGYNYSHIDFTSKRIPYNYVTEEGDMAAITEKRIDLQRPGANTPEKLLFDTNFANEMLSLGNSLMNISLKHMWNNGNEYPVARGELILDYHNNTKVTTHLPDRAHEHQVFTPYIIDRERLFMTRTPFINTATMGPVERYYFETTMVPLINIYAPLHMKTENAGIWKTYSPGTTLQSGDTTTMEHLVVEGISTQPTTEQPTTEYATAREDGSYTIMGVSFRMNSSESWNMSGNYIHSPVTSSLNAVYMPTVINATPPSNPMDHHGQNLLPNYEINSTVGYVESTHPDSITDRTQEVIFGSHFIPLMSTTTLSIFGDAVPAINKFHRQQQSRFLAKNSKDENPLLMNQISEKLKKIVDLQAPVHGQRVESKTEKTESMAVNLYTKQSHQPGVIKNNNLQYSPKKMKWKKVRKPYLLNEEQKNTEPNDDDEEVLILNDDGNCMDDDWSEIKKETGDSLKSQGDLVHRKKSRGEFPQADSLPVKAYGPQHRRWHKHPKGRQNKYRYKRSLP